MSLFLVVLTQPFWALTPKILAAVADVARFSACACGSSAHCAAAPILVTATTVIFATASAAATAFVATSTASTFPAPATDNSIRWPLKPDPRRYLFPCETTRIRAFRTDLVSPLECLRESRFSFKSSIATSESRTLSRGRCEFRADKRIGVTRPRSVTWHNFPLKTFHPQQGVNWTFLTGRPECVYFI